MAYLKGMPNLKSLTLGFGTRVSDKGLEQLAHLERLETLTLWSDLITDAGFASMEKLTNLKSMSIHAREYYGSPTIGRIELSRRRQSQVSDA